MSNTYNELREYQVVQKIINNTIVIDEELIDFIKNKSHQGSWIRLMGLNRFWFDQLKYNTYTEPFITSFLYSNPKHILFFKEHVTKYQVKFMFTHKDNIETMLTILNDDHLLDKFNQNNLTDEELLNICFRKPQLLNHKYFSKIKEAYELKINKDKIAKE